MVNGMFGGGLLFVVAAFLWAAVLVPELARRRKFVTTERHALRLQRTIRMLAETAELPTEVLVEATRKDALAHERLLRSARRAQDAEREAEIARARAAQVQAELRTQQAKHAQRTTMRAAQLRLPLAKRMRSIAALLLLVAVAVCVVTSVLLILGFFGVAAGLRGGAAATLVSGIAMIACALAVLVWLAPGRVKSVLPQQQHTTVNVVADVQAAPRPVVARHLADSYAAAQAAAAAELDRARTMTRMRTARLSEPAQSAAIARLRGMGSIEDTGAGMLDLDEVLRARRRAS